MPQLAALPVAATPNLPAMQAPSNTAAAKGSKAPDDGDTGVKTPQVFNDVLKEKVAKAQKESNDSTPAQDSSAAASASGPAATGADTSVAATVVAPADAASAILPFLAQLAASQAQSGQGKASTEQAGTTPITDSILAASIEQSEDSTTVTTATPIATVTPVATTVLAAAASVEDDPMLQGKASVIAANVKGFGDAKDAGRNSANQNSPVTVSSNDGLEAIANKPDGSDILATPTANAKPSAFDQTLKTAISAEASTETPAAATGKSALDASTTSLLATTAQANGTSHGHQSTAHTESVSTLKIDTPVGNAAWSNEVGDKLTWMVNSQRQQADLVLTPPQMGRIEISLTVTGDQATANFASPNAAVREMLEDSLPRLREILSGAGINLGEAQVGAESQSRSGQETGDNRQAGGRQLDALAVADKPMLAASLTQTRSGRGMVDIFA